MMKARETLWNGHYEISPTGRKPSSQSKVRLDGRTGGIKDCVRLITDRAHDCLDKISRGEDIPLDVESEFEGQSSTVPTDLGEESRGGTPHPIPRRMATKFTIKSFVTAKFLPKSNCCLT